MIAPHGGVLIDQILRGNQRVSVLENASGLPPVALTKEQVKTVENIAAGVYSPLRGFMTQNMLNSVVADSRLPDGNAWTLPVLLPVSEEKALELKKAQRAKLCHEGLTVAVLEIEDIFRTDKQKLVQSVYGTEDCKHPGIRKVMEEEDWFVGGTIWLLQTIGTEFPTYKLTPTETRRIFEQRGWKTVAAFQTRNAPHLGHEYVQKSALTVSDGLFLNPVIGRKKPGDFTDAAIVHSYQTLVDNYYRPEYTMLAVLEYEMEYAGPKEAIHHAIMRKNFGCTHMIIGRDHAGVGNFYPPYAAQEIFKEFPDLEIKPLIFNSFFYCRRCAAIANDKTCPHPSSDHVDFSGTKIRRFFQSGEGDLSTLMRAEVIESLLGLPQLFVK